MFGEGGGGVFAGHADGDINSSSLQRYLHQAPLQFQGIRWKAGNHKVSLNLVFPLRICAKPFSHL